MSQCGIVDIVHADNLNVLEKHVMRMRCDVHGVSCLIPRAYVHTVQYSNVQYVFRKEEP